MVDFLLNLVNKGCNRVPHRLASFAKRGVDDAVLQFESPPVIFELLDQNYKNMIPI